MPSPLLIGPVTRLVARGGSRWVGAVDRSVALRGSRHRALGVAS